MTAIGSIASGSEMRFGRRYTDPTFRSRAKAEAQDANKTLAVTTATPATDRRAPRRRHDAPFLAQLIAQTGPTRTFAGARYTAQNGTPAGALVRVSA